jgi:hypothetical protein
MAIDEATRTRCTREVEREFADPRGVIWERLGLAETEQAVAEIIANMRQFEAGGAVQMDVEVVVGSGVR